jgi:hypothetical protein
LSGLASRRTVNYTRFDDQINLCIIITSIISTALVLPECQLDVTAEQSQDSNKIANKVINK